MSKRPEDFSRTEDRFKLTLLQMEKRFVDLEMSVSELKDKLKGVGAEPLTGLQQRIDELQQKIDGTEDLIMVEQAGIIELKKMMEEIVSKQLPGIPPELEEKITKLEKSITDLVGRDELHERLKKIEKDIAALAGRAVPTSVEMETVHNRMGELQNGLASLRSQTESTLKGMYEKLKAFESREPVVKPGVDFDLLSSKIAVLKVNLDDISKKMIENSLRMSEFDKKFEIMDSKIREAISEQTLDEIKNNRKDLINTNVKIDSLERVTRELISSNQNLENSMKKFESIEKITSLSKNIEEKIERFKFIEEEIRRLSSRTETIYQNIDKEFERFRSLERKTVQISESLSKLAKEADKNKIDILGRIRKEDLTKITSDLENKLVHLSETMNAIKEQEIPNVANTFGGKYEELSKEISNLHKEFNENISGIKNEYRKIEDMKTVVGDVFKKMEEVQKGTNREFGKIRKDLKGTKSEELKKDIKEMAKTIEELETKLKPEQIDKFMSSMEERISLLESNYKKEINSMISSLHTQIFELKQSPTVFDTQINELVNRLVFLESRLGAVEKLMQEPLKTQPVILE